MNLNYPNLNWLMIRLTATESTDRKFQGPAPALGQERRRARDTSVPGLRQRSLVHLRWLRLHRQLIHNSNTQKVSINHINQSTININPYPGQPWQPTPWLQQPQPKATTSPTAPLNPRSTNWIPGLTALPDDLVHGVGETSLALLLGTDAWAPKNRWFL